MSDNNKDGFYGIITGTVEWVRPYSKGCVSSEAAQKAALMDRGQ